MKQNVQLEVLGWHNKLDGLGTTAALEIDLILFSQNTFLGDSFCILLLFNLHNSTDGLYDNHKDEDAGPIQTTVQEKVVIDLIACVGQFQHHSEDPTKQPWYQP